MVSKLHSFIFPISLVIAPIRYICEVICKNLPHGGANGVFFDQLFHAFVTVLMVETAQGATKMFAVYVHE